MRSFIIVDVPIHCLTFTEAVEQILRLSHRSNRTKQVITVNPEIVMAAQREPVVLQLLRQADLTTSDGIGIRVMADFLLRRQRLSYRLPKLIDLIITLLRALLVPAHLQPFSEVVTGSDLTLALLPQAASRRLVVGFLGATPATTQALLTTVRRQYPELKVCAVSGGVVDETGKPEHKQLITEVAAWRADLLFTAFGSPKGQWFIHRYQSQLAAGVAIEVGGTFDFLTGQLPRAPQFIRSRGFEWLFRLLRQPSRMQRIVTATYRFMQTVYRSTH